MTSEDKKILQYLTESYDKKSLLDSIDTINEYLLDTSRDTTSSGQTRGMQDKGVKGLLRAAPSAILSTAIFWPGALIALVGSLSIRAEKHWLRSIFNNDNWLDYISRPYREKWDKKNSEKTKDSSYVDTADSSVVMTAAERTQIEKQMVKENMKTYYAVLSNDEIFRVRALTEDEARKQIDKIIEFNPYEEMEKRQRAGGIVYMVYLNDFEQIMWCAPNAEEAKKEVMMTRKQLDEMYQKVGISDPLRMTGLRVDDVRELKLQEIVRPSSSYTITEKVPLSHRRVGSKSQEEYYTSQPDNIWTFKMRNSGCIYTFPARNMGEANLIASKIYIFSKNRFKRENQYFAVHKFKWFKVSFTDGDVYLVAAADRQNAVKAAYNLQEIKFKIIGEIKVSAINKLLNKVEVPEIKKVELYTDKEGKMIAAKWDWRIIVTKSFNKEESDNTPMTDIARKKVEIAANNYKIPATNPVKLIRNRNINALAKKKTGTEAYPE